MSNENTLLANARASTSDELDYRRSAQLAAVHQFWEDELPALEDYAAQCIPDSYEDGRLSDWQTALESVRRKLRRCKATSRESFLAWAVKQLAKEKGFHLQAGAIQRFDIDVSNWIDNATLGTERHAKFKPEKDGGLYRQNLGTTEQPIVWTIPEKYLYFAEHIWPVYAKRDRTGFYAAKKICGVTVPVHHFILPVQKGDTVQSSSGNFLDWTSLYVRPLNRSGIYENRNTSWNAEADRPNSAQEEFESRFQSSKALENYGTNIDGSERYVPFQPVQPNADLAGRSTAFGKVVPTGWSEPITPSEQTYAPERYPSSPSTRVRIAARELTALGL